MLRVPAAHPSQYSALAESPHFGELVRLELRDHGAAARPLGAEARRALAERFGRAVSHNEG